MASIQQAEELMQCDFTARLVFQRAQVLRNYAFWGFTPTATGGFLSVADTPRRVSSLVAIGHVESLETVESTALGLFATAAIADGAWIGEYTGVVQVEVNRTTDRSNTSEELHSHDAYGMCYPSVYEGGQLYLTAAEIGNEIRCINHSATPNAKFTPTIHMGDGILHVDCVRSSPPLHLLLVLLSPHTPLLCPLSLRSDRSLPASRSSWTMDRRTGSAPASSHLPALKVNSQHPRWLQTFT
jgi:hypothetical protein